MLMNFSAISLKSTLSEKILLGKEDFSKTPKSKIWRRDTNWGEIKGNLNYQRGKNIIHLCGFSLQPWDLIGVLSISLEYQLIKVEGIIRIFKIITFNQYHCNSWLRWGLTMSAKTVRQKVVWKHDVGLVSNCHPVYQVITK